MNELMFYTPDKKGFVRISYVFLAPLTNNLCSVVCVPRIFFSLGKTSLENISLAKGHKISEDFFFLSSIQTTNENFANFCPSL